MVEWSDLKRLLVDVVSSELGISATTQDIKRHEPDIPTHWTGVRLS